PRAVAAGQAGRPRADHRGAGDQLPPRRVGRSPLATRGRRLPVHPRGAAARRPGQSFPQLPRGAHPPPSLPGALMTPELAAAGFAKYALSAMADVAEKSAEAVDAAAELIADAVRSDGIVQAFGTGHSQAVALEIAGRAGGLIPTNRIRLTDL